MLRDELSSKVLKLSQPRLEKMGLLSSLLPQRQTVWLTFQWSTCTLMDFTFSQTSGRKWACRRNSLTTYCKAMQF